MAWQPSSACRSVGSRPWSTRRAPPARSTSPTATRRCRPSWPAPTRRSSGCAELAHRAGARKAERLCVRVPSHCPLLEPVARELAAALAELPMAPPSLAYVSGSRARLLADPDLIRADLAANVALPVRWHDTTVLLARARRPAVPPGPAGHRPRRPRRGRVPRRPLPRDRRERPGLRHFPCPASDRGRPVILAGSRPGWPRECPETLQARSSRR